MMQNMIHPLINAGSGQPQPVAPSAHTFLFTLVFAGGQVALLTVYGASDQEQARSIASTAIKNCQYTVVDGDHTGGNVHCFFSWCHVVTKHDALNDWKEGERSKV